MKEDYWFRAYVKAIRHDVDRAQCEVTALVETLLGADPELRQKYEDHLREAEKRLREEISSTTDDTSLPEENPSRQTIERNFRRESQ